MDKFDRIYQLHRVFAGLRFMLFGRLLPRFPRTAGNRLPHCNGFTQ
jgi:hypothetical protein